jgi:hypothetical protein
MVMTFEDLVALIGLVVAVISIVTPIMKLTKTMAELTIGVQSLKDSLNDIIAKNHDAHSRMWGHNKRQDEIINEHEKRIGVVETKLGITPYTYTTTTGVGGLHIDEQILDD